MAQKTTVVSPPMTVRYANLGVPSTTYKKEGQYTVKCAMSADSEELAAFKAKLEEIAAPLVEKATAELSPAQKKRLIIASPFAIEENQETGEETGYQTISFSMTAQATRKKDGKVFNFRPDVFDGTNQPIPPEEVANMKIGSGSIVRVSFTADRAYCMEAVGADGKKFYKAGLSVDMKAVKILKLVEFGGTAESHGFGDDDEGEFTRPKAESPFDEEGGEDVPKGGDF